MTQGPRPFLASLSLVLFLAGADYGYGQDARPARKTFIDYFLPMPVQGALSKEAWGAAQVGARDPKNGLEDPAMKQWNYWDGQILKAPDGKYHLFASRWEQARGHSAWTSSKAVHAVSDHLLGPYVDQGLCWPNDERGKGHNVTALVLPDGRYAVVISETRPGTVYVSKSPDGPWEKLGTIQGEGLRTSNVSLMVRPDGDYMIVPRSGQVFISKAADGILGPYKPVGSAFPKGIPNLEDPVVFYSGGLYHIVVNSWSLRKAFHLTSKDGKTDWVNRGLAYDPTANFCRYTDRTVNHWNKLERPGVVLENGHVIAMTFAVIDTPKESQHGNDGHGSKIIVVPFDGAALDRDLQEAGDAARRPSRGESAPPVVDPGPVGGPPADAVVLFDGKDMSKFRGERSPEPRWKLAGGVMETTPNGGLLSKEEFGDCQVHVEWAAPSIVRGDGQGRGNSGVYLMGRYEIQVLDSYNNPTYPNGQCGAFYGHNAPLVNVCRKPGEWQTYDIIFHAPKKLTDGVLQPGSFTVLQNGVLIQDHVPVDGRSTTAAPLHGLATKGPLYLQDHGNPVRFRNVWVRRL
jgi:hypothetical protein